MSIYKSLKKILHTFIPKSLLFKIEYPLRSIYYLFYKGDNYQCNICQKDIRNFITSHHDKICPRCGSLSRTRRLWQIIDAHFDLDKLSILDFSPSRSIYRILNKEKFNYTSSDLSGDFISTVSYDITAIDAKDESYDLIICYHVLEHVENDIKAMQELKRVLSRNGSCVIQTPFKTGEIYEDYSIKTPEQRLKHFGQDDHVRIYSAIGLKERLENVGFKVKLKSFEEKPENRNGFKEKELLLICQK